VGAAVLPLGDLTRLLRDLHPPLLLHPQGQPGGHHALLRSLLCRRCAASWIR
jgi:hypothetical protein